MASKGPFFFAHVPREAAERAHWEAVEAHGLSEPAETMTPAEVAVVTGFTVGTLATRRSKGLPPMTMAGHPVRYRRETVLAFVKSSEAKSAAQGRRRVKRERAERDQSGMGPGSKPKHR